MYLGSLSLSVVLFDCIPTVFFVFHVMLENEVFVVALLGFVIRVLKTYLKYSGFG
jgi:hypothetical protein